MHVKEFTARVKAAGEADGLEAGQFEAIVSVFGNKDSVGDVVVKGAFTDDLVEWGSKDGDIPVIWSHDWSDPFSHIGSVVKAEERDEGLYVLAQIHDLEDNPKAAQVYRLLKGRRVTQFSFAYDILDAAEAQKDGETVYELRKLHVHEVGPTLLGANQATELLTVKAQAIALAADAKAGRVLAAKHIDSLRTAQEAIGDVIKAAEANDQEKASGTPTAKPDEEPSVAKSGEEPTANPSAADLAAATSRLRLIEAEGVS